MRLLLPLSLLLPAAALACDAPVPLDDLVVTLDDAEQALSVVDIGGFKAATVRAQGQLRCLDEPLTRHAAAQLHRVEGLRAFGERDPDASLSFAAARRIEPRYRFPTSLVPKGSPILESYHAGDTDVPVDVAPLPERGFVNIDGRTTRERPVGLPSVLQRLDDDGGIVDTHYLLASQPLPTYPTRPEPTGPDSGTDVGPTGPPIVPDPEPPRARRALLVAGIGAGAASGVLYGAALAGKARYKDTETGLSDPELDSLKRRTNAMATASGILGLSATGALVAVAIPW